MRTLAAALLACWVGSAACDRPVPDRPEPRAPAPAPAPVVAPKPDPPVEPPRPPYAEGEAAGVHYAELVTGEASADATLPMIVAIHGLGDDPLGFGQQFEDFPGPARWVFPRALDAWEGGGYWWFPVRARDGKPKQLSKGIKRAADAVARAIAQLKTERPTRGLPVVTGFSQGGMVTFALAIEHPDLIAAAFPVSGWLPPPLWPTRKPPKAPPIVAFHGDDDPAVALGPTKEAIEHLNKLGYDAELRAYEGVGHSITPAMHRDLYDALERVTGGVPDPVDTGPGN